MESLAQTNPAPPSGIVPTEVPLGISGTISETPMPVNIPLLKQLSIFHLDRGVFLGNVTINSTTPVGTNILTWRSRTPLVINGVGSSYYDISNETTFFRTFYPAIWDLLLFSYAMECRLEFSFKIKVVKIGDSRCSLDFVFNQSDADFDYSSPGTLANDSFHKIIDDPDDLIEFDVPMIWPTDNVPTKMWQRHTIDSPAINMQSPFIPYVRMQTFVRSRYQRNLMQFPSFNLSVFLHVKVINPVGIAGNYITRTQYPDLNDSLPIPWVYNQIPD